MADVRTSMSEFFEKLVKLFETNSNQKHGSIFLSQKRLSFGTGLEIFTGKQGQTDTLEDIASESLVPILIRATNGASRQKIKSKVKISTIVQPNDIEIFYSRYAEICRSGMLSLKKRDRSAQKKKARKRRVAAEGGKQI